MAGNKSGAQGVGKGRRMPVQQSVDIGAPIETVYNQWTQFEEWPNFMHRVTSVTQEDDCTVSFATKIWTRKREFSAKIETQRPDQRIKWKVSEGLTHTGVVTFHELGPNLTRVLLGMDVEPGGMIEKMARGMRYVKRAARADLHRFKAFIEMSEQETGAWRGVIEDGELVEEHDPSYDEQREYADVQDLVEADEEEAGDEEAGDDEADEEEAGDDEADEEEAGDDEADEEEERDGEDDDEEPATRRARKPSRASSARRASRSRGSSGSRSGSSGGRSRSSHRSGDAAASGRGARAAR